VPQSAGHPAPTLIVLVRLVIAQQSQPADQNQKMKIVVALLHATAKVVASAKLKRPLVSGGLFLSNSPIPFHEICFGSMLNILR